ncbi:hypothetical protein N7491_007869 [Penicillium cf. griseofulvum]|nr:hypothetical protein N7491_007869 [Penicillium cf. griseofulvum]
MTLKMEVVEQAGHIQTLVASLLEEWEGSTSSEPPFDTSRWNLLSTQLQTVAERLITLTASPRSFIRTLQVRHYDLVAYQIALEFDLFTAIPIGQTATISVIAERAGVDPDRVGRALRLLGVHGVFCEIEEDCFGHTQVSELIAQDEAIRSALAIQIDEMFKAASSTADAIRESPLEQNKDISPFSVRFGTPIYDFYQQNPDKANRFGLGMKGASDLERDALLSLRDAYPWSKFAGGTIVDVGGGMGHVSIFLAESFPSLSFVVQDIFPPSPTMTEGNKLATNVEFCRHDFFQPQPITPNARAYLLKHALHNQSDADCVRILSALVPALEQAGSQTTPLLINEGVLPEFGQEIPRDQHLTLRRGDMCMMVTLGAKERTSRQFQALLSAADSRFQIRNIYGDKVTKLIEVYLSE